MEITGEYYVLRLLRSCREGLLNIGFHSDYIGEPLRG